MNFKHPPTRLTISLNRDQFQAEGKVLGRTLRTITLNIDRKVSKSLLTWILVCWRLLSVSCWTMILIERPVQPCRKNMETNINYVVVTFAWVDILRSLFCLDFLFCFFSFFFLFFLILFFISLFFFFLILLLYFLIFNFSYFIFIFYLILFNFYFINLFLMSYSLR